MFDYYLRFKKYYEGLKGRERWLVALLGWVIIYLFFDMFFYKPVNREIGKLAGDKEIMIKQIDVWQTQIAALNQLQKTPQYQQWLAQKQLEEKLRSKFKTLTGQTVAMQWQAVISSILHNYKDIRLVSIIGKDEQNTPGVDATTHSNMVEQHLVLTIYGNYFNTIQYIQSLEQGLGGIKWANLDYAVVQYPIAKVELELAVIYEKQPS